MPSNPSAEERSSWPPLPEPVLAGIYDNHTHLNYVAEEQGQSWREQLNWAEQSGVRGVITVGVDVRTSRFAAAVAAEDSRVLAALALHPNTAAQMAAAEVDEALHEFARLAQGSRVAAIGETGLDYFRTEGEAALARQLSSFEKHIELAKQLDLPMQIHDREAHDDVVATLQRVGAPERTVFHCFSGDVQLAEIAAANGWYCSFAGTVSFKNAQGLRDALSVLPPELVLIETDAPYLTPHPYRGRPNASYLIVHTLRAMAAHLGEDEDDLAEQLNANTEAVYGSWDDRDEREGFREVRDRWAEG